MVSTTAVVRGHATPVTAPARLRGLDGVRGLAALFVVLHHCYLLAFPGYPSNTGPHWLGWLLYGHIAVVVFIVLSGFSLAVSPARSDWHLGSLTRFAHRRAWRILPPYWAALAFSLIIAWTVVAQPGEGAPTAKSVVINGLLLQDIFGAPSPNGAFWSIAIEAQLYLVFPLLLLVVRRANAAIMLGALTTVVVCVGALAPHSPIVDKLMRLTPQFAALFGAGAVAAGIVVASRRVRRAPWPWLAAAAAAPVLLLIVAAGPEWTTSHYFWIDLALGPAVAIFLASLATGKPAPVVTLLETTPVRSLGSFSYSLYLTHAPIVVAIYHTVVQGRMSPGLASFGLMLAVALPIAVLFARGFAALAEIPFQRHRSWRALRGALLARLERVRAARLS